MNIISKLFVIIILTSGSIACSKKSNNSPLNAFPTVTTASGSGAIALSGEISVDLTLTKSNKYILQGIVYVKSGVSLTIQAGTVILGEKSSKGMLVIERGAKIFALGNADSPVVFTSEQPIGARNYGDWGGVVICGNAPHNQPSTTAYPIGIRGTMGGDNKLGDNSGGLRYTRIEFAGASLSPEKEGNALTLYAVGSITLIDHVQVSYSANDSFSWIGGDVNSKRIIAFRGWDDDWDCDWGWNGYTQFGISLRDPLVASQSGSNAIEADNFNPGTPVTGANAGLPLTKGSFSNMGSFGFRSTPNSGNTANGSGSYQSAMHIRRNASVSIYNSFVFGWPEGLRLDGTDAYNNAVNSKTLVIKSVLLGNLNTPYAIGTSGSQPTVPQVRAFFENRGSNNTLINGLSDLGYSTDIFNLTTPAVVPTTSGLNNSLVSTLPASGGVLEPTSYIGPFNVNGVDWTAGGWSNFDPQNVDY